MTASELLLEGVAYVILSFVLLISAFWLKELLTPYSNESELKKGNLAAALSLSGYFAALIIIFLGVILTEGSDSVLENILSFALYAGLGIVLLNISRYCNDKLLLRHFSNAKEIITDRNAGTGIVECGSYIASGCVIAGAVNGDGGGLHTAIVFFILSQVVLLGVGALYDWSTPYDLHREIERDNVAVGISFAGSLVAVGVIIMGGTSGDFISWYYNLIDFLASVLLSFVLLPLLRYLFDTGLIPGMRLDAEVAKKRNAAVAVLEAIVLIGFAAVVFATVDFGWILDEVL